MIYYIAFIVHTIYKRKEKKKKSFGQTTSPMMQRGAVRVCAPVEWRAHLLSLGTSRGLNFSLWTQRSSLINIIIRPHGFLLAFYFQDYVFLCRSECWLSRVFYALDAHPYSAQEECITVLRGWRRRAFNRFIAIGEFMFGGEIWDALQKDDLWTIIGL